MSSKDSVRNEVKIFKKEFNKLMRLYDADVSGELDIEEIRYLFDELRKSMFLPPCDDDMAKRIFKILDSDGSGAVDLDEIFSNIKDVFPLLQETGKHLREKITKDFNKLDEDNSGFLEKNELKALFKIFSQRHSLPEPEDWQVDYIVSELDDDGNGKLDLKELIVNYRLIMKEMVKFFHIKTVWDSESGGGDDIKNNVFGKLEEHMKQLKQEKIKKIREKRKRNQLDDEKKNVRKECTIDMCNEFGKENSKERIPLTNQLNNNKAGITELKKRESQLMKESQVKFTEEDIEGIEEKSEDKSEDEKNFKEKDDDILSDGEGRRQYLHDKDEDETEFENKKKNSTSVEELDNMKNSGSNSDQKK